MLRCACYTRFSTDKQTPISTEDQIRKCREFAEAKGWALLEHHLYADEAVSGAGADRDGLKHLIAAAESQPRPFYVILMDDTSRLSRNVGARPTRRSTASKRGSERIGSNTGTSWRYKPGSASRGDPENDSLGRKTCRV
jgi:DNA invertase Pin-like site-specific DNA recombinase